MSNRNRRDGHRHKQRNRDRWEDGEGHSYFAPEHSTRHVSERAPPHRQELERERSTSAPTASNPTGGGRSARRVEVECIIRQNEPNLPGILITILGRSNGNDIVAMPEWLAADRGLKVREEAGEP